MKWTSIAVLLAFCLGAPSQNTNGFHWDWRSAQEIGLNETIGKTVGISEAERRELIQTVSRKIKKTMQSETAPSQAAVSRTRVRMIDFNADGVPDLVVQPVGMDAGCGATGNCPFWVFLRTPIGLRLILDSDGQVFNIEPTLTNGVHDIVLGTHDSASERTLYIFRYSDGRYRQRGCYNARWWVWDKGRLLKLKEPRVSPSSDC